MLCLCGKCCHAGTVSALLPAHYFILSRSGMEHDDDDNDDDLYFQIYDA